MKATEEQITARLQELRGWEREDVKWIRRKYRFDAFLDGIEFVRRVADSAEKFNHHPLIAIDYKVVTLRLTTWNEGGLTELDFASATAFDKAYSSK